MPLVGYLSTNDPGRISSICRLEGKELKAYRRKIRELNRPNPTASLKEMYMYMYVRDCLEHARGGVVAPVVLKRYNGAGFEVIGTAKCCPLCWVIIEKPFPDFPDPKIQEEPIVQTMSQKEALRKGRRAQKAARKPWIDNSSRVQELLDLFATGEEFTTAEVMSQMGLSRTAVLRYLERLMDLGKVVREGGSRGRGDPTMWHGPWEKEA
jgi:biotin operon repressor